MSDPKHTQPTLLAACHKLGDAAALTCGLLILLASFAIVFDILARNIFGISLNGADELSGYALAITSTWALTATLLARRHIRIDSLYAKLPIKVQLALDIAALLSMLVFFGFVLRYGWILTARSFSIGAKSMTPLATPLAIPQSLWLAGLVVFVVVGLIVLGMALLKLLKGDWSGAQALVSNRDAQEEINEEIHEAAQRQDETAAPLSPSAPHASKDASC